MKRALKFIGARTGAVTLIALGLIVLLFAAAMGTFALANKPMSTVDEHVHLDYALKLHAGELVHRGSLYEQATIDEWACGVGHEGGGLEYPCGDPRLEGYVLPAGKYTSGYIHYPTYFAFGELFRIASDATGVGLSDISTYRLFSALVATLSMVSCAAIGWLLGLRRWQLIAATLTPSAATTILVLGTIVNPGSSAVLSGALIAGAGIAWIRRGCGFVWLAVASALASVTAVTNSLPAVVFILAIVGAIIAGRWGWRPTNGWRPRWFHGLSLGLIVVLPVVAWGRYISATATVPNDALYGFAAPTGRRELGAGIARELFSPHVPWAENDRLAVGADSNLLTLFMRSAAAGVPVWIAILTFGALVFIVLRMFKAPAPGEATQGPSDGKNYDPLWFLSLCLLASIVLYAPALRFTNSLTFGFDFPITTRYSIAFVPMLMYLLVLQVPGKAWAMVISALAGIAIVGVSLAAF